MYLLSTSAAWRRMLGVVRAGSLPLASFSAKSPADAIRSVGRDFAVKEVDYAAIGGRAFYVLTNGQGDTAWTRVYGGINDDNAHCVRQTADGGYIIVGPSDSPYFTNYDIKLVRLDANGDGI